MLGSLKVMYVSFYAVLLAKTKACDAGSNHSRIVGGSNAFSGEFPYHGFLVVDNGLCGCSLILDNWAITAAHCVAGASSNQILIYFGSIISYTGILSQVQSTFVNPDYDSKILLNDIALLKLKNPITFSGTVAAISLPHENEIVEDDTDCLISGFGSTSESGGSSSVLLKAVVPVVENQTCINSYKTLVNIYPAKQICAGYEFGGVDSCQGDSGGALVCPSKSGMIAIQGVTSFGVGCARAFKPGIYTRVSSYISWIETTIQANSSPGKSLEIHWILISFMMMILMAMTFE